MKRCPKCGTPMALINSVEWRCYNCGYTEPRHKLYKVLILALVLSFIIVVPALAGGPVCVDDPSFPGGVCLQVENFCISVDRAQTEYPEMFKPTAPYPGIDEPPIFEAIEPEPMEDTPPMIVTFGNRKVGR